MSKSDGNEKLKTIKETRIRDYGLGGKIRELRVPSEISQLGAISIAPVKCAPLFFEIEPYMD